jgi:excisionase family DNA binding protein
MIPTMYTKKEVADTLKVNQRTLDRLVATGRIIPTRIGRQIRFTEESVNELIKSGEA